MQNNIYLKVSIYGMSSKSYLETTGRDNFTRVFNNIDELIKAGYTRMTLAFVASYKTINDLEAYCYFIEKNNNIKGVVYNDIFGKTRYYLKKA